MNFSWPHLIALIVIIATLFAISNTQSACYIDDKNNYLAEVNPDDSMQLPALATTKNITASSIRQVKMNKLQTTFNNFTLGLKENALFIIITLVIIIAFWIWLSKKNTDPFRALRSTQKTEDIARKFNETNPQYEKLMIEMDKYYYLVREFVHSIANDKGVWVKVYEITTPGLNPRRFPNQRWIIYSAIENGGVIGGSTFLADINPEDPRFGTHRTYTEIINEVIFGFQTGTGVDRALEQLARRDELDTETLAKLTGDQAKVVRTTPTIGGGQK